VAERLVLHAPAHLVQAPVGDAHDVERVGDAPGVIEARRQPGPEALGQVGGHHPDGSHPRRVGTVDPSPQVSGAVALDHVDDHVSLQVDQAGGVDGGVGGGGGQERRLVDAELAHPSYPGGVVDERRAVLDHRVHHRPPAHAELLGHLRDRAGELADLAACLGAGATGHDGLAVDLGRALRPGLGVARRLCATPPPLAPDQTSRPAEAREIAHTDKFHD
jgi:hypothetical protein